MLYIKGLWKIYAENCKDWNTFTEDIGENIRGPFQPNMVYMYL